MPKTIVARDGDTLCTLAMREGFLNCDQVRADPANAALLNRRLRAGDRVTIPDPAPAPAARAAGARHGFRHRSAPPPSIRLVHGTPDRAFPDDPTLARLNISNYVTDKAGADGTAAFTAAFGFNADADQDPDVFKVEVVCPGAGASIRVLLEALKPVYRADGAVARHELFTGAEYNARRLEAECQPVGGGSVRYRSRYLRLVSDEADRDHLPTQTLMISDMADGLNGDNDRVEILDQRVRASFVIPACRAAAPDQCSLRAEAEVGESRSRIRLAVHVYRAAVGGAALVGGVTEQMLRRRVMKWFRRAYAQANLSPRLSGPAIEILDPPAANMITISNNHGRAASGVNATGAASTLSFRLGAPPGAGGVLGPVLDAVAAATAPTVTVNLTPNMTPAQVGAAIVAALPAGYTGRASTNAVVFNRVNGSCDVIITKNDGTRVVIRDEQTTDTALSGAGGLVVPRVNLGSVDDSDTSTEPTTPELRRVLREGTSADDRLDFFVIGSFANNGLRGLSYLSSRALPAHQRNPAPLRWAVIMASTSGSGAVMDGSDNLPFTFPHESGHVINDAFHTTNVGNEMMSAGGTSVANSVTATKRICDSVQISYDEYDPAQANQGDTRSVVISAVQQMRTNGAPVIGGW